MPKLKRPSLKQRKFAIDYVKTGNATQAALNNYDTTNRKLAQRIGAQNLDKPEVQTLLEEALKKSNITFDRVLDSFNDMADQIPDKISSDTVLKANIERAKLLKMYPERVQKYESKSISINLNQKNYLDLIDLHKQKSQEIADIIDTT